MNTSNNSVSQFIQGFTETGGSAGPSGLSAPKYLQFDTNFVDAPDAGLVPEPGTITLGLASLACFGHSGFAAIEVSPAGTLCVYDLEHDPSASEYPQGAGCCGDNDDHGCDSHCAMGPLPVEESPAHA